MRCKHKSLMRENTEMDSSSLLVRHFLCAKELSYDLDFYRQIFLLANENNIVIPEFH